MRLTSVATALGMLAIATASFAAPTKVREAWASGQLERFDATAKSVVVKQGAHEMTFTLAPNAHLMSGKRVLQPEDLSNDIGHRVTIRYSSTGTERIASRIEVSETAKSAAATLAAAKPTATQPTAAKPRAKR